LERQTKSQRRGRATMTNPGGGAVAKEIYLKEESVLNEGGLGIAAQRGVVSMW